MIYYIILIFPRRFYMSKKHYSKEFIAQILELYDAGKTIQELSSEYGVSQTSINRWIDTKLPKFKTDDGEQISVDDYQKLKKENNRLKLELEILKKATAIFAKGN